MSIQTLFTDSKNNDFAHLIQLLDADLGERYGDLQKEYDQHNKVDLIKDVIVIYNNGTPVACGAYKEYDSDSAEIKRVFVKQEYRKQGLAKMLIYALEQKAKTNGYKYCILETGARQPEAIHLYKALGYDIVDNYAPYVGNINSICMRKSI